MYIETRSIRLQICTATLLIFMNGVSVAAANVFVCQLHERVALASQNIVLADICSITGDDGESLNKISDLTVGQLPRVGYSQTLTRNSLSQIIAPQLHDLSADIKWSGAANVKISVQEKIYAHTQVEHTVRKFFMQEMQGYGFVTTIEKIGNGRDLVLPVGEVEFKPRLHGNYIGKQNCVWLDVYVNSNFYRTLQVWVVADVRGSVLVAKHNLDANTEVSSTSFEFKESAIQANPDDYITLGELESHALLTSSLKTGQPVLAGDLAKCPDVISGKLVNVSIVQGSIRINMQGIARHNANAGETVKIRLLHNDAFVMAKVIGKQLVSVI